MGPVRAALFGAALAACVRAGAAGGCDADPGFDYFLLALQWPAAFGAVRKGWWTLHGLWPSRAGAGRASGYPCACSDEPFDAEQLSVIRPELDKFWPTLMGKRGAGDESFWGHEWGKHGTCSRLGSQLAYFNSTLATRAKYDPGLALAPPAVLQESTVAEIKAAVRSTFGFAPLLGCKVRKEEDRQYLNEIGYCLTTGLELQVRRCCSLCLSCATLPADHALVKPLTRRPDRSDDRSATRPSSVSATRSMTATRPAPSSSRQATSPSWSETSRSRSSRETHGTAARGRTRQPPSSRPGRAGRSRPTLARTPGPERALRLTRAGASWRGLATADRPRRCRVCTHSLVASACTRPSCRHIREPAVLCNLGRPAARDTLTTPTGQAHIELAR